MDFIPKTLYQDDNLLLCRKPHGIASSRGQEASFLDSIKNGGSDDSVRSHQISVFGEEGEYGLLNRLDNVTSGLLYFARSYESKAEYTHLQEQGLITKTYYAQVYGTPRAQFGQIKTPIYHHRDDSTRMTTDPEKGRGKAQEVVTYWEKIMNYELGIMNSCLLKITITSGCRHQIRCHLASIGHPIVGDRLYMTKGLKKQYAEFDENKIVPQFSGIQLVSAGLEISK